MYFIRGFVYSISYLRYFTYGYDSYALSRSSGTGAYREKYIGEGGTTIKNH